MELSGAHGESSLVSFMSGMVVGLVTGLLVAPQTGRQTREQVGNYAGRASESLKNAGQKARRAFDRFAERTRAAGTEAMEEAASAGGAEHEATVG